MKLFNIVQPQVAVFEKDYQQLAIIKGLVKDLALPIRILSGETVRAQSGLALSSRNVRLNQPELKEAPRLRSAMQIIYDAIRSGDRTCCNGVRRRGAAFQAWMEGGLCGCSYASGITSTFRKR